VAALGLATVPGSGRGDSPVKRTKSQVEALIRKAGATPPDWWDSVKLDYPETLDLTWDKKNGLHEETKNTSLYLWWVCYPNPSRWKPGVKLLHHMLKVNQRDPGALQRTMTALGSVYHDLLQDYARAAFWWRKVGSSTEVRPKLAHCYWRLGSKEMAVAALSLVGRDDTQDGAVIKVWADMGDLGMALRLAEDKARRAPEVGYLAAGDACREAGKYDKAVGYYAKVLRVPESSARQKQIKLNKQRAQANLTAVRVFDALNLKRVSDGIYTGSSLAYAGALEVAVYVRGHRLASVKVTKHEDKQFFCALTDTSRRIVDRQGVKGVDAVSGATMTSEAILNATAEALSGAMK
jgi:uncharacterized protein with FMN-binding domain